MADLPLCNIKRAVELGNRVYVLDCNPPVVGWVWLAFTRFTDHARFFNGVRNARALVMVHMCSDLADVGARYAWQPRTHAPPAVPVACPRCRYRIDYKRR